MKPELIIVPMALSPIYERIIKQQERQRRDAEYVKEYNEITGSNFETKDQCIHDQVMRFDSPPKPFVFEIKPIGLLQLTVFWVEKGGTTGVKITGNDPICRHTQPS